VRWVELTIVLREAHGEGGKVTHNRQLEKSCFGLKLWLPAFPKRTATF